MRHRLSLITTFYTFFVLFMGNLVTATGAKDGCGSDWPGCNGSLFPDITDPLAVIEYTHRMVTGGLGFLILINFFVAWRRKLPGEREVGIMAALTVILLITQSLVGGINVMLSTPPGFSTIDVSVSLAMFSSIILLTIILSRKPVSYLTQEMEAERRSMKKLFYPILTAIILFYIEISLGAFFKHSGASSVFAGITKDERLIHSPFISELIYDLHGIFTFIILVSALWVLFYAMREKVCVKLAAFFAGLVMLEGLLGFITVVLKLETVLSSLHMLTASFTLGVGVWLAGKTGFGKYYVLPETQFSQPNIRLDQHS
ncbi:MAG: heme A synthase [Bacillaceae bacterium]|nr:heme A synthase [Bacillaceae bacterium]